MSDLSQPQRKALADAYTLFSSGLHKSDAGWSDAGSANEFGFHADSAIKALVERGLLRFFGQSRALVHITSAGALVHDELKALIVKPLPFSTDAVTPKRQVNADGSVEFRCEGCGVDVFCAVDDGFEFPACLEVASLVRRTAADHQRPEYRR